MARPKIMDDAKIISVVLDRTDLEAVEKERGDFSISSYLRSLIRETQTAGNIEKLQKELRTTKAKLNTFERKEKAIDEEHVIAMRDLAESFTGYLSKYPNAGQRERDNWLSSRCKDSCGLKPPEILSYISLENPSIVAADKI